MASGLAPSGPSFSGLAPSGPSFSGLLKPFGLRHSCEIPAVVHWTARPAVAAADDPRAGNRDERDRLRLAWLEPHRGACRDIEAHPVGRAPVEHERAVCLDEVIVAADLNRTIAAVGDLKIHRLPSRVEDDLAVARDHG